MDNNNYKEDNVSLVQQPTVTTNNDEEEIITQLTLANLRVLMVRKGDQIIYKLPNNIQVSSIAEEQRQQLMNEIQSIHAATMAAAANAQQQQQQQQQQSSNYASESSSKPIAPKILDKLPQPTAAEFDAMKETARNLREEFERQQQMNRSDLDCQSPTSSDSKSTRRYNKTGRYSKKRQVSQYLTGPQQFVALQPSIHPQSGVTTPIQPVTPVYNNKIETDETPMKLEPVASSQQQASSILSKRLPEEEFQHREIKKRFLDALILDRQSVTSPNYDKPFSSVQDAIERLLPYHIYQYSDKDLNSNQSPLEKQDNTTIEIFKCKVDMFEKHNNAAFTDKELEVLISRQIISDQRQKVAEEQSRIATEQTIQKQEMIRIQAEQARVAEQQARQQMQPHQILANYQPPPPQSNYSNRLAQANALLQNPEFIGYYSQLSPESQQNLLRNREQLVALLEKQQLNHN